MEILTRLLEAGADKTTIQPPRRRAKTRRLSLLWTLRRRQLALVKILLSHKELDFLSTPLAARL